MKSPHDLAELIIERMDNEQWEPAWATCGRALVLSQGSIEALDELATGVMQILCKGFPELMTSELLACPDCGECYYSALRMRRQWNYLDLVARSPRCSQCETKKDERYSENMTKVQQSRDRGAANRAAKEESSE